MPWGAWVFIALIFVFIIGLFAWGEWKQRKERQ